MRGQGCNAMPCCCVVDGRGTRLFGKMTCEVPPFKGRIHNSLWFATLSWLADTRPRLLFRTITCYLLYYGQGDIGSSADDMMRLVHPGVHPCTRKARIRTCCSRSHSLPVLLLTAAQTTPISPHSRHAFVLPAACTILVGWLALADCSALLTA